MGAFMQGLRAGLRSPGETVPIPAGYERDGWIDHSREYVQLFTPHAAYHVVLERDARKSGPDVVGVVCAACGAQIMW